MPFPRAACSWQPRAHQPQHHQSGCHTAQQQRNTIWKVLPQGEAPVPPLSLRQPGHRAESIPEPKEGASAATGCRAVMHGLGGDGTWAGPEHGIRKRLCHLLSAERREGGEHSDMAWQARSQSTDLSPSLLPCDFSHKLCVFFHVLVYFSNPPLLHDRCCSGWEGRKNCSTTSAERSTQSETLLLTRGMERWKGKAQEQGDWAQYSQIRSFFPTLHMLPTQGAPLLAAVSK